MRDDVGAVGDEHAGGGRQDATVAKHTVKRIKRMIFEWTDGKDLKCMQAYLSNTWFAVCESSADSGSSNRYRSVSSLL